MRSLFALVLAALLLLHSPVLGARARAEQLTLTFEFVDACDDGYSPEIDFYLKDNPGRYWGTYWLRFYNEPMKAQLACSSGQEICFGAWLEGASWGCGKNCPEPVKGACFACQEAVISVGLQCNR